MNQTTLLSSHNTLTRRDVFQLAAAFGLSFALPGLEPRAAEVRGRERKKSLLTVWLGGGPSQLETWDPHPGAAIGGDTKAIGTRIRGLQIADLYPRIAEQIDALSVVRSLVSKEGDHERGAYMVKTGYRPDPTVIHPSLGAVLARHLPDTALQIPAHVSLGNSAWPARGGYLGAHFDAFKVFDPGRGIHNMQAHVHTARQKQRLKNLDVVSNTFRSGRKLSSLQTLHQRTIEAALQMMDSEQLRAFDLKNEPKERLAAYGDTQFGRGCLVARNLIKEGVRAVEVALEGFDTHSNNYEGHKTQAAILDPALAALLEDLRRLELLDSTVVLVIGEFGRTPRINALEGRDHWPTGFSCLIGGGGLAAGRILGETDPTGTKKDPADPVAVADLLATVLRALGVDFAREELTPIGRPLKLSTGAPIERLFPV